MSLPIVGIILSVAQIGFGIMSAVSQGSQASAQQKAANQQAAAAQQQAQAAAEQQKKIAAMEAESQRIEDERVAARQRALMSVSGVQMGTGTPLAVELDTARLVRQRESDVIYRGDVAAHDILQRGANAAYQYRLEGYRSKLALGSPLLNVAGAALRGAPSLATGLRGYFGSPGTGSSLFSELSPQERYSFGRP